MFSFYDFVYCFFFFNDTATTEIYTLSLHDALPIYHQPEGEQGVHERPAPFGLGGAEMRVDVERLRVQGHVGERSEEHTSELQSRQYLVCRLLLEKKKNQKHHTR